MIDRMQTLKRKLEALHHEEHEIQSHSAKRINHLQDLYAISSLADVKYDEWSRTRLDRLMVDYLLRAGYADTAAKLAKQKQITDLVDLDTFISCHKIASNLARGDAKDALNWCNENRLKLKALSDQVPHNLEFELRLQQYIELVRIGTTPKKMEAMLHAQRYLAPHGVTHPEQLMQAAGLLAQTRPINTTSNDLPDDNTDRMVVDPPEPYRSLFSPARWKFLSTLFISTYHTLLSLPTRPLLHVALSAGLSALKTPACHSQFNPTSSATDAHPKVALSSSVSTNSSLCPICSTELNDLARSVPYAHHTKSYVEPDPMVLPNARIYGRKRLEDLAQKMVISGVLSEGQVKDPITGEVYSWNDMKKVFIS